MAVMVTGMSEDASSLGRGINHPAFLSTPLGQVVQEPELVFRAVPAQPTERDRLQVGDVPWRIVLSLVSGTASPIALELRGDVVIGSDPEEEGNIDVNLADWQGQRLGVSRRHIMLRPNRNKLFVMDLHSTNGTHINGLPLGIGWAYALQDGDTISLARLHIRVRVVQHP
jgi:hypothetical protein